MRIGSAGCFHNFLAGLSSAGLEQVSQPPWTSPRKPTKGMDMEGLNSGAFGPESADQSLGGLPTTSYKSQAEMARDLGTQEPVISAIKSGDRGLSPELAKKIATKSGDGTQAATLFLQS